MTTETFDPETSTLVVVGTSSSDVIDKAGSLLAVEIQGLEGNDTLIGSIFDDRLYGGGGNDHLDGGDGNDELYGGDDNDTLIGGSGADVLTGGAGDDTLVIDGADTVVSGGADMTTSSSWTPAARSWTSAPTRSRRPPAVTARTCWTPRPPPGTSG